LFRIDLHGLIVHDAPIRRMPLRGTSFPLAAVWPNGD